jgi:VIT1/CCC1 family predicted Fe2+/Mn2+ transporter
MLDPISVNVIARVFLIVGSVSFWCHVSQAVAGAPAVPVSMLVAAAFAAAVLGILKGQRPGRSALNHWDQALCYAAVAGLAHHLAAGS